MANVFERYQRGTSFTNWVERLGYFFKATDVVDSEMQKAYLITLLDSTAFSELKVLCSNKDLKLVPYEQIVQKLQDRYDRKECGLIQRYKFHNRVQQPNETVQEFIDAVKLQAELCCFGNFKLIAIVDRIVIGIRDKILQRRLLCEDELTLAITEKIISTWELMGPSRGRSVKERLGVVRVGRGSVGCGGFAGTIRYRPTKVQANQICCFCGTLGHTRKQCYKLKALTEKAMNDVGMGSPEQIVATDEDETDENCY